MIYIQVFEYKFHCMHNQIVTFYTQNINSLYILAKLNASYSFSELCQVFQINVVYLNEGRKDSLPKREIRGKLMYYIPPI